MNEVRQQAENPSKPVYPFKKGAGPQIRRWRVWAGLTQAELARIAFPGQRNARKNISNWEAGRVDIPTSAVQAVALACGVAAGLIFYSPKQIFPLHPTAFALCQKLMGANGKAKRSTGKIVEPETAP